MPATTARARRGLVAGFTLVLVDVAATTECATARLPMDHDEADENPIPAVRQTVQESWFGEDGQGGYDPSLDRYSAIGASEQNHPSVRENDLTTYLDRGAGSWNSFPHFHVNSGYSGLSYGSWTSKDSDAYTGPFTVSDDSPTPLVAATTCDPATPNQGARELVQDMGNARLLTMDGDNHTACAGNSSCIDGTLPTEGARCRQQVPFLPALPDLSALQERLQNPLPLG